MRLRWLRRIAAGLVLAALSCVLGAVQLWAPPIAFGRTVLHGRSCLPGLTHLNVEADERCGVGYFAVTMRLSSSNWTIQGLPPDSRSWVSRRLFTSPERSELLPALIAKIREDDTGSWHRAGIGFPLPMFVGEATWINELGIGRWKMVQSAGVAGELGPRLSGRPLPMSVSWVGLVANLTFWTALASAAHTLSAQFRALAGRRDGGLPPGFSRCPRCWHIRVQGRECPECGGRGANDLV
jgi:hypothetical protein